MIWHRPEPGPLYWDWRCVRCGEAVRLHAPWWRRLFHRPNRRGETMISRILHALSTRRCHGCVDRSPHSHHLTWIGRRLYT